MATSQDAFGSYNTITTASDIADLQSVIESTVSLVARSDESLQSDDTMQAQPYQKFLEVRCYDTSLLAHLDVPTQQHLSNLAMRVWCDSGYDLSSRLDIERDQKAIITR
jgi:hypothetical protein